MVLVAVVDSVDDAMRGLDLDLAIYDPSRQSLRTTLLFKVVALGQPNCSKRQPCCSREQMSDNAHCPKTWQWLSTVTQTAYSQGPALELSLSTLFRGRHFKDCA